VSDVCSGRSCQPYPATSGYDKRSNLEICGLRFITDPTFDPPGYLAATWPEADTWPAAGLTRSPECRMPREALSTESDHHAGTSRTSRAHHQQNVISGATGVFYAVP
jgi:hypothetical protein